MKKKVLIIPALALIFALSAPELYARPGGDGPPPPEFEGRRPHHHHRMPGGGKCFGDPRFMKEELGLSDKQIEAIEAVNLKHKKFLLEQKEKLDPKRTRLKRLLLEDKVDLRAVEKILTDMSKIEVQLRLNRIRHRMDIEKVLTPDQKKKLRRHNRHGRMHDD